MDVIIILLLIIELCIVLGFIYLITGMKKFESKPFFKSYEFFGIVIPLCILIFILGLIVIPTAPIDRKNPTFTIEISRDNQFEIIEILDELSKKNRNNQEVCIKDNVTITYNSVGQIADIKMGVFIPEKSGYMYYYSNLMGDNLVFTKSGEATGEFTISYCKDLFEEYYEYIKNIDADELVFHFDNSEYHLLGINEVFVLQNDSLTRVDKNNILIKDNLIVKEYIKKFNIYGFENEIIKTIIV